MDIDTFRETLYEHHGQWFTVDEVLYENRTDHFHLVIFSNPAFGRVMALDGIIQTTEKDEFIYHEMLTHVPLLAHGAARDVLVVGGGDGAMVREISRHQSVERIMQAEIDPAVIEMSLKYLPDHAAGSQNDPRLEIVFGDGAQMVNSTERRFDVIISDATDPIGPGEALFTEHFYAGCKRCLKPGGILVTQNGVPFLQAEEVTETAARLRPYFEDVSFYSAAVPTYIGGIMCFAWATDDASLRDVSPADLQQRFDAAALDTRYYTPSVHKASFALPRFVEQLLQ